jgi:hypothetical protein
MISTVMPIFRRARRLSFSPASGGDSIVKVTSPVATPCALTPMICPCCLRTVPHIYASSQRRASKSADATVRHQHYSLSAV